MNKILTMMVSAVVIAINIYFVASSWLEYALQDYRLLTILLLYFATYFAMCIYLILHTFANMANNDSALSKTFLRNTEWKNKCLECWNDTENNKR